ncbi:MAG: serine/threonine-protein kinase [Pyrinomonadaceae bacterium]
MIDSGTILQGRFLIEDKIGMGGMGAVYRAIDQKFGSVVAVKETFYGDRELGEAFEREARLLNGLHHPIFPHVSDYFTENGGNFLVMEYIEGEDLSEIIRRGEAFAVNTVLGWTLDILDGLDYLHSREPPIIHRDIKPNNLKLTSRGKIVLLDFGMAKETSQNTLDAKSVFGYSRRYSPLEQIEGTGTDPRSDIFSLGASVYHLLTGEPPVDVLARASAIVAGRPDPLVSVSSINPDVSESVAAILNAALALNAEKRFESARAMSNALEYAIDGIPVSHNVENDGAIPLVDNEPAGWVPTVPAGAVAGMAALESNHKTEAMAPHSNEAQDFYGLEASDEAPLKNAAAAVAVVGGASHSAGNFISRTLGSPDLRRRLRSALPTAIPSVQIRRPARFGYSVWVPVLLICLALALYGTYRGLRTDENESSVSTDPTSNLNADSTEAASVRNSSPDQETSASLDAPESTDIDESELAGPEEQPTTAATNVPSALNLKKGPIAIRPEPSRRSVPEAKQQSKIVPERNAVQVKRQSASEPIKPVSPAFEQQPHVSSIEAIFTGVPSENRRRLEDDRGVSSEDEMRRRRMRQIMRENRRRQLPF